MRFRIMTRAFTQKAAPFVATMLLLLAVSATAVAAPGKKLNSRPVPTKRGEHKAKSFSHMMPAMASTVVPKLAGLIKPEQMGVLTDLIRFFTENSMELLTGNRDNRMVLKPLSGNKTKLLSDNEPKLCSENEAKLFSENRAKLCSENRAELLSGNSAKLFSDISLFSGINVNVNIRVEKSGNKESIVGDSDKVDSAFHRLDRNGDGKISPDEFRAAMGKK